MAEYIEREALVRQIICNMAEFIGAPDDVQKHDEQCNYAINMIEDAPVADVAPVVHCRDCKYQTKRWYSDKRFRHGGYYFYGCDNMENSVLGQDNDFCARAERKIT